MPDFLTPTQADALDRDNRQFYQAYSGGLSQLVNDLEDEISSGPVGINSASWDIDSVCLGGGAFSLNASTTAGTTLGYYGGRVAYGQTVLTIAAGTIALSVSATNYVEIDPLAGGGAGAVVSNTAGFTAGRIPLYVVVCGVSSITSTTVAKVLLKSPPSIAALTKSIEIPLGGVSGNLSQLVSALPAGATLSGVAIGNTTAVSTSNTNYWTFALVNTGPSGTGTTNLLGAGNSTQLTGGSALVANVMRSLSLTSTTANLVTAAGDGLVFSVTGTGAPTNLTGVVLRLDFVIAG
jgi:hypothetical protein